MKVSEKVHTSFAHMKDRQRSHRLKATLCAMLLAASALCGTAGGEELWRELKDIRAQVKRWIFEIDMMAYMDGAERALVHWYFQPPVAPDELRELALEILGDRTWADRLAGQVEQRIADLRIHLEKAHVEPEMVETLLREGKSIRQQQLEKKKEESAKELPAVPGTPPATAETPEDRPGVAAQAPPASPPSAPRWPWIAGAALVALSVLTVVSLRIRARR